MKMYAVKNDEGKFAFCEIGKPHWETGFGTLWTELNKPYAQRTADDICGHVVELIEAPAKVVVSEAEDKILKRAKDYHWRPAAVIEKFSEENWNACPSQHDFEDRLMRAYVNGWTVEKPKRYVLPMPGTDYHNIQMHGNAQYYAIKGTGNWRPDAIALGTDDAVKHGYTVTQSDIDAAPAWVKAITPVEVTDNEQ